MDACPSRRLAPWLLAGLIGLVAGYSGDAYAADGIAVAGSRSIHEGHRSREDVRAGSGGSAANRGFSEGREARREAFRRFPPAGADASIIVRPSLGRHDRYDRRTRDKALQGGRSGFETHGSITVVRPRDPRAFSQAYGASGLYESSAYGPDFYGQDPDRNAFEWDDSVEGGIALRGINGRSFSTWDFGGDPVAAARPPAAASGWPKIIDVAAERLDRRPVAPGGIEVLNAGGAKIIRIAPDYHASSGRRTADAARDRPRPQADDRQPWSSGWLRYCTKAYYSFDPQLGTYVDRNNKVRFYTAD